MPNDIQSSEILDEIFKLKPKKGTGPQEISSLFLQNNAAQLIPHLTRLFNEIYTNGSLPSSWKCSYLQPVPKKGSMNELCNYRGIAISSCIPKLFDKIITRRLNIGYQSIKSQHQHGFTKKQSTTTNLIDVTQRIHQCLAKGSQMDVVYFDISKAFDRLNHRLLAIKLAKLGIPNDLFYSTMLFVLNRTYTLKIGDKPTNLHINPNSAVPQGSCAGPVLYLLYSLDSMASQEDGIFISAYADDTKIMSEINSIEDTERLQRAISNFHAWCVSNNFTINTSKTAHVSYYRRSKKLDTTYVLPDGIIATHDTVRDLGVIFDSSLTFRPHIDNITQRAKSMLAVAGRFAVDARKPALILNIFRCHIMPILEYAAPCWDQQAVGLSEQIEKLQKKATKSALRLPSTPLSPYYVNYEDRLKIINSIKLSDRRIIASIIATIKFVNSEMRGEVEELIKTKLNTARLTRAPNIFKVDHALPSKSPAALMIKNSNKMRHYFKMSESISTTKMKLRTAFLETDS